jgi:hypothetical protein
MRIIANLFAQKVNAKVYLLEVINGHSADPVVLGYLDKLYMPGFVANLMKM